MQLEGDAYNWYMWRNKSSFFINWNAFKDDLYKRFQGIKEEYLLQNSLDYHKRELWTNLHMTRKQWPHELLVYQQNV